MAVQQYHVVFFNLYRRAVEPLKENKIRVLYLKYQDNITGKLKIE